MRRAAHTTTSVIKREWDRVAHLREEQIQSGKDLSLLNILIPTIADLTANSDFTSVMDAGCGTGYLTADLSKKASQLVAVDLSNESIQIAKRRLTESVNITFFAESLENFAEHHRPDSFTLVVANMTLMTAVSLDGILNAISKLLRPGGHFVFTITHPWFWPFYWGYANEGWFDYSKEIAIESPWHISLDSSDAPVTTHIHRPLMTYINSLHLHHLNTDTILEPMPTPHIEKLYPKPWSYPRFLGGKCICTK